MSLPDVYSDEHLIEFNKYIKMSVTNVVIIESPCLCKAVPFSDFKAQIDMYSEFFTGSSQELMDNMLDQAHLNSLAGGIAEVNFAT